MMPAKVMVEWIDASIDKAYDGPIKDAGMVTPIKLFRLGYYLGWKKDPATSHKYIVISTEVTDGDDSTREVVTIPFERVVSVTELELGKKGDLKWLLARAKSRK